MNACADHSHPGFNAMLVPSYMKVKKSACSSSDYSPRLSERRRALDVVKNNNYNNITKAVIQSALPPPLVAGGRGKEFNIFSPLSISNAVIDLNHESHHHEKTAVAPYTAEDKTTKPFSTKGGVRLPFPAKLYYMLQYFYHHEPEVAKIISWQPHGRCFMTHDTKKMEELILPRFFNHNQYSSFRRNLNIWGFKRLTQNGLDHGAYYHEHFLRGKPSLCHGIKRSATKMAPEVVRRFRVPGKPESEPRFYNMTAMPPSSSSSTDDILSSSSSISAPPLCSTSSNTTNSTKEESDFITPAMPSSVDIDALDGGLCLIPWIYAEQEGTMHAPLEQEEEHQKRNKVLACWSSDCLSSSSSTTPHGKHLQLKTENTSKRTGTSSTMIFTNTKIIYEKRAHQHNRIRTEQNFHDFSRDETQEERCQSLDFLTPIHISSPPMSHEEKKEMVQILQEWIH
jgi:hypothetical protein